MIVCHHKISVKKRNHSDGGQPDARDEDGTGERVDEEQRTQDERHVGCGWGAGTGGSKAGSSRTGSGEDGRSERERQKAKDEPLTWNES